MKSHSLKLSLTMQSQHRGISLKLNNTSLLLISILMITLTQVLMFPMLIGPPILTMKTR